MNWEQTLELLTPMFCRGAYQEIPELRPPSIRGMVRWWFRALGGTPDEEKAAFGGMNRFGSENNDAVSSRLVFRIEAPAVRQAPSKLPALPHKQGGMANPQAAFASGGTFRLRVISRRDPLPPQLQNKVLNALEVWTLVGSLGLRANRGGGSIWPAGAGVPTTEAALRSALNEKGFRWPVCLAPPEAGFSPEALRAAATDTVPEPVWLFGRAKGGRQASILKMKVIRLDGQLRLLITAPDEKSMETTRLALQGHRSRPEAWRRI